MGKIIKLVVIWALRLIYKIIEWISDSISESRGNQSSKKFTQKQREIKYWNREINKSDSLFDRNFDIIQDFACKIDAHARRPYYIENLTRDCINEICLAENKLSIQPGYSYLSSWKPTAGSERQTLATQIESYFNKVKWEIREIEEKVNKKNAELKKLISNKLSPEKLKEISKKSGSGVLFLEDINAILKYDWITRKDKEKEIINWNIIPKQISKFSASIETTEVNILNKAINNYNKSIKKDIVKYEENSKIFKDIYNGFKNGKKEQVLKRIDYILNNINFPWSFPKLREADFDSEQSIAIVEFWLPDIVHNQIFKKVELKSKTTEKPITKSELKEDWPKIHPAILLRIAYEIFLNDDSETIKLLVLNGWVEYDNPATGVKTKTYTTSLMVNREQILELNLKKLNPLVAFQNLKGKSAWWIIDIIPIAPTMSLNRKDKRFIETKEVLNNLNNETNLASMDWQDFESLIAELFEKEFAEKWAEVKVTQSSRDRWVDAIVFDPDPIKWGKFVVQAKRYTRTVDVSAVRDLCAVVKKEWASRGILVTTSSYGSDAYTFADNEPVTLLNWSQLLWLLEKHGYKFRINISEARKLLKKNEWI